MSKNVNWKPCPYFIHVLVVQTSCRCSTVYEYVLISVCCCYCLKEFLAPRLIILEKKKIFYFKVFQRYYLQNLLYVGS